jgi:hypothetical protein
MGQANHLEDYHVTLNLRILAVPATEKDVNKGKEKGKGKKKPTKDIFTKNIVYKELLTP